MNKLEIRLTFGSVFQTNIKHGIVQCPAHEELQTEVVNALGITVCLVLLRLVPIHDQSVSESQTGGGVGGLLVAVEHATSEGRLHMAHQFLFKLILLRESLGLVALPGLTLRLGDRRCKRI